MSFIIGGGRLEFLESFRDVVAEGIPACFLRWGLACNEMVLCFFSLGARREGFWSGGLEAVARGHSMAASHVEICT